MIIVSDLSFLALKHHPDRNPGREVESSARFQAIQAAHEILIDPNQRLKYDTDRLRNGYYGNRPTPRRAPATSYAAARPNTKAPFSERPKSYHQPSSGAQRYASYARAAPKQPWEKMRDEAQTRADAFRGFQDMKGNAMPGWSSFDPRTGRAGQPGAAPRPAGTAGSARPKSAYEHMSTGSKPSAAGFGANAQSAKKRSGFAPRAAAGGDEPMAPNTTSYRNASRNEQFGFAPSPTARKPAGGFFPSGAENVSTPEYERTRSTYASTGGEKTFFSSSMLGRSGSARAPPKAADSGPRTNPPIPDHQANGRHRSASPSLKEEGTRNRNYDSTSSSGFSDDEIKFTPKSTPKQKAMPKSRLRQQQKFTNLHTTNGWFSGAGRLIQDLKKFF